MKPHLRKTVRMVAACLLACPLHAWSAAPAVNLTVWLRQVDQGREQTVTTATESAQRPLMSAQQIRVRNGARASFRMEQAVALQWVTAASGYRSQVRGQQSAAVSPDGGSSTAVTGQIHARSEGGSFQQQTVWLQSGQSLVVQPQWAGGQSAVEVTVDFQQSHAGPGASTMTPRQDGTQLATSVYAALGEWVTIAATGSAAPSAVVSTRATREPPRALQVRVTLD